jgi:hypothetical protein
VSDSEYTIMWPPLRTWQHALSDAEITRYAEGHEDGYKQALADVSAPDD